MAKYEDQILDFFKKQKDENKAAYIFKVAAEIMDLNSIEIETKDGRLFVWETGLEKMEEVTDMEDEYAYCKM